jgi:hypothetical protein
MRAMGQNAINRKQRYEQLFSGELLLSRAWRHVKQAIPTYSTEESDAAEYVTRCSACIIICAKIQAILGERAVLEMADPR